MAVVKWAEGFKFSGTFDSGHSVILDASVQAGGKNEGPQPIELLLVALGTCSGMDVISILQRQRLDVRAFEINVSGVRREAYPRYYTAIQIDYVVTGRNLDRLKVERAVKLSEKYCSVYPMLAGKALITSSIRLVEG
jgi:putative redox protein